MQQLREAFPEAGPYRYAILDHDSKFNADMIAFMKVISSAQTSPAKLVEAQSLWPSYFHHAVQRWANRDLRDHSGYISGGNGLAVPCVLPACSFC